MKALREIAVASESTIPTSAGEKGSDVGFIPVPVIVEGTQQQNGGEQLGQPATARVNILGFIPFAKSIFKKKAKPSESLALATPVPQGELVVELYDSAKELLSKQVLPLQKENSWEVLSFEHEAEQQGYVTAYIQGTSTKPVSFDDFTLQTRAVQTARLYQENHYYPFGMNMQGLENSDFQSESNKDEYKWKFNERNEREQSFGLFWDETKYRSYDFQLGRFMQVDPKAENENQNYFTTYHYAYNNPIRYNDPNGDIPPPVIGAAVGAIGGAVVAAYNGGDAGDIATAAVAGAIGGAFLGAGGLVGLIGGAPAVEGLATVGVAVNTLASGFVAGAGENLIVQVSDVVIREKKEAVDSKEVVMNGVTGLVANGIAAPLNAAATKIVKKYGDEVVSALTSKESKKQLASKVKANMKGRIPPKAKLEQKVRKQVKVLVNETEKAVNNLKTTIETSVDSVAKQAQTWLNSWID